MCDNFLKVEWIDKEKMIGYTHYEAFVYDVHRKLSREKQQVWALVKLADDWASYSMDVYEYKRQGRMNELFDLVKNGTEIKDSASLEIKYRGNITVFYALSPVLSGHDKTICLAYPDEKRAWIIEGKDVRHVFSKAQRGLLFNRIREAWPSFKHELLEDENLWVLDVNFDGQEDFVFRARKIAYSFGDKLYSDDIAVNDPTASIQYSNYLLTFPPQSRTCRLKIEGNYPLTTDGKNYYVRNCNLSELTAASEKPETKCPLCENLNVP